MNIIEKTQVFYATNKKGEQVEVRRNQNWDVNITQLAKQFNKRWVDWERRNKKKIELFEKLEGKPVVYRTDEEYPQTYINFKLAVQVLNSYDDGFAYHLSCIYERFMRNILDSNQKEISILEQDVIIAKNNYIKLLRARSYPVLRKGHCVYIVTSDLEKNDNKRSYKFGKTKNINTTLATYRRLKPKTIIIGCVFILKDHSTLVEQCLKVCWKLFLVQQNHEEISGISSACILKDLKLILSALKIEGTFLDEDEIKEFNDAVLC